MSDAVRSSARGRVAVAVAEGTDLSAMVGEHFGRSPRFLLVRRSSDQPVEVLQNDHAEAPQGSGPAAASLLRRHGVTAVLAGRFGPRADDALRAAGILPVSVAPGTRAADALARYSADVVSEAG